MRFSIILIILLLSSCSAKISNFDEYQKSLLSSSSFLPSKKELNQPIPKVVVFPFEENDNVIASQAGLGKVLAASVEKILAGKKLAIIVDRKMAKKLEKEISLIEASSSKAYDGPQIADYAISGSISNASFTSRYQKSSSIYNSKTKTYKTTPAKYIYYSTVSGSIKIYDLPNFDNVRVVKFDKSATDQENVGGGSGVKLGPLTIGESNSRARQRDDGLVREAGNKALASASSDIMNNFAKNGYILEKRVFKQKSIFKINLGSKDGVQYKDRLDIYGKYEIENPITKESEIEVRLLGEALVSDQINPANSWIIIKDKKTTEKIRLGDRVKLKYKPPLIDGDDIAMFLDVATILLEAAASSNNNE